MFNKLTSCNFASFLTIRYYHVKQIEFSKIGRGSFFQGAIREESHLMFLQRNLGFPGDPISNSAFMKNFLSSQLFSLVGFQAAMDYLLRNSQSVDIIFVIVIKYLPDYCEGLLKIFDIVDLENSHALHAQAFPCIFICIKLCPYSHQTYINQKSLSIWWVKRV